MPANLSPDYKAAEAAFRQASEPKERLERLREMLRTIPKHKGTEHLQADIKTRIKQLTEELAAGRKGGARGGPELSVRPEGAAQVALIGPPNAGKSSLHAQLTGSHAVVGPYPFATKYPLWSVVTVLVWQWSPFMMLIVLAGLQGQDSSVLEAARVDGATSWGTFRQITFPQLRPYLELGTLLGAIYLIQVYDHIEVITGGSPDSKNLPFYIAQRSIGGGNRFGLASSYSIIVVIASIIIANIGLRVLSGLLEDDS